MAPDAEEIVRTWIWAFENDGETFRETLHPEIEWRPFEHNHTASHGVEAAVRIREQWLDSWETMHAEVDDWARSGDDVVASLHVVGQGKTSGVEVDVRLHLHFKVRDGKVSYIYEHVDRAEALDAAGVRE